MQPSFIHRSCVWYCASSHLSVIIGRLLKLVDQAVNSHTFHLSVFIAKGREEGTDEEATLRNLAAYEDHNQACQSDYCRNEKNVDAHYHAGRRDDRCE
jgi:hypothetical protein